MQNLHLKLNLSATFISILLAMLAGSTIALSYAAIAGIIKFLLFLGVIILGGYIFYRHIFLKHPYSIVAIQILSPKEFMLIYRNGDSVVGKIRGDSTRTRFVSILRFDVPHAYLAQSCVIFNDAIHPDLYRKLLAHLF